MRLFNRENLVSRLERMSAQGRLAFAAACLEHLLSLGAQTEPRPNFAGREAMASALRIVRAPNVGGVDQAEIHAMQAMIQRWLPNEDNDWNDNSAWDQSAGLAALYMLDCAMSGSSQDAVNAAVQVYEAADHMADTELGIDWNDPDAESRILSHPRVQNALDWIEYAIEQVTDRGVGASSNEADST